MFGFLLTALLALLGAMLPGAALAIDEASIVRGGRLYDHWSRESRTRPPSEAHPLLASKLTGLAGAQTWRCATCHGWDYRGANGFVGIRSYQDKDPAAIVALLKDPTHRYGELLRDRDLQDIANFVSKGQFDLPTAVEKWRNTSVADTASAKTYTTICANCHGQDGSLLREVAPLGDAARQRPLEVMHVLLNGHPGGAMPALSALGTDRVARIMAYTRNLPTLNIDASVTHGGRLYDNWQAELGAPHLSLPHPAYPRNAFYANDALLTWRCSSCHGWDYRGNRGVYATGRHATGIKGINAMAGADPSRIAEVLADKTHRYDAVLKHRDLQDLANFVSAGQIDMENSIDRQTRAVRGDALRGSPYYRTICAGCHGLDGQHVGSPPLGGVVRANPWGALHTVLNGHPAEKMPAMRELDRQMLLDVLAHVQGLPEVR